MPVENAAPDVTADISFHENCRGKNMNGDKVCILSLNSRTNFIVTFLFTLAIVIDFRQVSSNSRSLTLEYIKHRISESN